MALKKDRVKPTHYPKLPFHIIRSAQLLSSTIVACIMMYFLHELSRDHYKIPWTFILLLAVSLLTVLALTATIILHCFYGLNPILNTILNSFLALLWTVSFSLLSWWSSGTLSHVCNAENWEDELGISVCRIYKALFSFSLLGMVATLLALMLDIHVQRQSTVRGRFQQLQILGAGGKSNTVTRHREVDGFEEQEMNPTVVGRKQHARAEGYALPEEQYVYDEEDTAYHGAAGQGYKRSSENQL